MRKLLVLLAIVLGASTCYGSNPLLESRAGIEQSIRHSAGQANRGQQARTYTVESQLQDGKRGNFIVTAPTQVFASKVAQAAEYFRYYLAVEWLGRPLPGQWQEQCAIRCKVGDIGAGGATTFTFNDGEVFGWDMYIQGTEERILDSVLPHEVLHTIFASHYRRPMPRWADEGAATCVEHTTEKLRQKRLLDQVITTSKRIPLRELFHITEYPRDMQDVLTLYAEGYSVTEFLVDKGGKKEFCNFLTTAHKAGWDQALHQHYSYRSVEVLEREWLDATSRYTRAEDAARTNNSSVATKIRYFTSTYCAPCKQFERDSRANPQPLYEVSQYISLDPKDMINIDQRPDLAQQYNVRQTPTWVIYDQFDREMGRIEGYNGLQNLIAQIRPYLRKSNATVPDYGANQWGNSQNQWEPAPKSGPLPGLDIFQPGPTQQQMIDWSQVKVILLVSQNGESPVLGAVKEAGLAIGSKKLEEYFHEVTGGKGALVIVAERTQPDRFNALLNASKTPKPDLVSALIAVAEEDDGIKGMVTGVVKSAIERRIGTALAESAAINPFFERIDPVRYNQIMSALQTQETSLLGMVEGESPLMKLLTAVVSGLGAMKVWEKIGIGPKIAAWRRRRKDGTYSEEPEAPPVPAQRPPQPAQKPPVKAQAPKPSPVAKPAVKPPAASDELTLE